VIVALGTGQVIGIAASRWIHLLSGITWIGLLYYFNFVQVDALKKAGADNPPTGAGITKHVAPRALLFFRWGAVATVLFGLMIVGDKAADVLLFREKAYVPIGIGAWLGLIMLFNVWVLIWPNQKKILGLMPASDEEKARARRVAFLASRTNTMLSIPMLFFMVFAPHGGSWFGETQKGVIGYWIIVLVLWAFIEASALGFIGGYDSPFNKAAFDKHANTIWAGFILLAVIYLIGWEVILKP
jgi:uncharacterized membrane protein